MPCDHQGQCLVQVLMDYHLASSQGWTPLGTLDDEPCPEMAARGRDYYLAPAYPMLLAAGAAWAETWLRSLPARRQTRLLRTAWTTLGIGGLVLGSLMLPLCSGQFAVVARAGRDVSSAQHADWLAGTRCRSRSRARFPPDL